MKKLFYLAAIALLWMSCKKEEIHNPSSNPPISSSQLKSAGDVIFCNEASLVCEQNGVDIFLIYEKSFGINSFIVINFCDRSN
jgi:hypothetical protein